MTIDDLALQFAGFEWIAAQDPVSLAESRRRLRLDRQSVRAQINLFFSSLNENF